VSTAYGIRGSHWSCRRDSAGNGIHTGVDFAAPTGAKVVAARSGTVRHRNYGSAFGYHQVAVTCSDGTEDFYAHMRTRVADGTHVSAGDKIGEVGSEGNVTGPHLHFEKHNRQGSWSCEVIVDPMPSVNSGSSGGGKDWFDMATEADLRKIVAQEIDKAIPDIAHRVNQVLGDFDSQGKQRPDSEGEQANARLRQIETVVRRIDKKVGA